MNYQRKTLLAGIAALALVAGAGAAPAQETPKSPGSQTKPPQATQQLNHKPGGNMGQSNQAPGGKMGPSAQQQNHGTTGRAEQNPAQGEHNDKAADQQNRNGRENNAATQREHNGLQGLQGNATGMHAQLTEEQRTRIRNTVTQAAGAPRVGSVDFDVTVGTVVPRGRIQVIPVPEMLVQIEPEWRGFLYFVYEDEVVIVNPSDMRIVAVVPA
jgi:Protein of unknown function (DUF1236)